MVRINSFQMMATMLMVRVMPMVTMATMVTMVTMEMMTKMMELPGVYQAGGKCEWVRYDRLSHPHRHFYMYLLPFTDILTVPHIFIVCSTNMVTKLPTLLHNVTHRRLSQRCPHIVAGCF